MSLAAKSWQTHRLGLKHCISVELVNAILWENAARVKQNHFMHPPTPSETAITTPPANRKGSK